MRLIDADALRDDWLENGENQYVYDRNAMLDSIDAQPTIDAVPVVRDRPLSIDELKKMHGKPVWIEQENAWGIVAVNEHGLWKGMPFVVFFYEDVRCEYDIESRGLTCYRYKPVVHGR